MAVIDIRRRSMIGRLAPATASGAVVMALGIFGLAALQQMDWLGRMLTKPLALSSLAIWIILAGYYLTSLFTGRTVEHTQPLINRFAVGTWVAGTAVLSRLMFMAVPPLRAVAVALGLLSCVGCLLFLLLVARALPKVIEQSSIALVPGSVLLTTVSIQSVALVLVDLVRDHASYRLIAAIICGVGLLFYFLGATLIVRSHIGKFYRVLRDEWSNTNCVLHGALSITGLAAVAWSLTSSTMIYAFWICVLIMFVIIETIELARLFLRVREYGWRKGALSYHTSQWARNFTFGMFYAFTLAMAQQPFSSSSPAWFVAALQEPLLAWGASAVLIFLVLEILLWASTLSNRNQPS